MSKRENIEKIRMEAAYKMAQNAKSKSKYASYVQKIPAYIYTNGIANTFLFIKQGDGAWKIIYQQFIEYFIDRGLLNKNKDLIENIIDSDDNTLKLFTKETLALINWLRRFAK